MNYWIFTVTDHDEYGLTSQDVLTQRLNDAFWGLGERTANRNSLEKGDRVVFYMGTPIKSFAATATLTTAAFKLTESQQSELSHNLEFYRAPFGVRLENSERWQQMRQIDGLIPALDFIKNKRSWGAYFQGGIRGIDEKDYRTITQKDIVVAQNPPPVDIDDQAEFALENHLEDFLDQNWDHISFGSRLSRYVTEGQDGRQFPAGQWSIDFLCVDHDSGDFVVIELKRGKTSDAVVGQMLRYIAWVKRNLAKPQQSVRGIIIAKEADDALRYAIADQPHITLLEYRVDFQLRPLQQLS